MKIDKKKIKIFRGKFLEYDNKSPLSPANCLLEVWELTKEVFALSKKYDVESRLQRNVIHFTKGKG